MTTENLRMRLVSAAHNAKTPIDIVEAIKTLPAGTEAQIPDFIAELCRVKGIDPQANELQSYYKLTAEYKIAQENQEKRAALCCVCNILS